MPINSNMEKIDSLASTMPKNLLTNKTINTEFLKPLRQTFRVFKTIKVFESMFLIKKNIFLKALNRFMTEPRFLFQYIVLPAHCT